MKQLSISLLLIVCLFFSANMYAQDGKPVQTIRGIVTDQVSGAPVPFVSVALLDLPQMGTTTDDDGKNAGYGR